MRVAILTGAVVVALGLSALPAEAQPYDRLRCESEDYKEQFCRANIAGDVRVVRQLSDKACREGRSWRWSPDGIRVRDGCRAEFEYRIRRSSGGGGWGDGGWGGGGGGWGGGGGGQYGSRYDVVTCQSENNREEHCPAPIGGDVRVVRRMSDAPCIEGRSYSWNRDSITVYGGCRAEFRYRRRDGDVNPGRLQRVTCQSQNEREDFCPAPIAGNVRVVRNISDTDCRENRNWSWTPQGVRVWGGCRAEFQFRASQ